jgi:hypothetical protein
MAGGFFTPKGFDSKAQGQRRSRATLGNRIKRISTPKGFPRGFVNASLDPSDHVPERAESSRFVVGQELARSTAANRE